MTTPSSYVRNALLATRAGLPDPALLIDLWLDRLLELLEPATEAPGPAEAYDLLALFGRLKRCRAPGVEATGRQAAWEAAARIVEGRLADWVALALRVPDPEGWLREAGALADACDDGEADDELGEWAEQLLTDLDDADLVAWSARRCAALPAVLEQGLARSADWLRDNPDRFFPAGVFIQGAGQAIRPDLPAFDLDLAGTADKFVLLLDALQEIEARMGPAAAATVPRGDDWAGFPEPSLALAAAAPVSGGLFRRRWRSVDGTLEALLVVEPDGRGAGLVRINFLAGDDAATALAGRSAWLAGQVATIDAKGDADFARAGLLAARAAGLPLRLCVGDEQAAWQLLSESDVSRRLRWDELQRIADVPAERLTPSRAIRVVDALGWLAPWWLRPEVVARAVEGQPGFRPYLARPALPTRPGGCWALFVQPRELPLLRPALLLPLCWEPGGGDDPYLPGPLRELAEQVRRQLLAANEAAWALRLDRPEREEPRDLSALGEGLVGASSAWASLAGGLLLARDGLAPSGRAWASAAWSATYGIGEVGGVTAKLSLAAEWGAEQVFVPAQNEREASAWRQANGDRPAVQLLLPTNREPAPARVLEPYLEVLGAEPGPGASFEVCCRYYARLGRERADAFYWARLQAEVVALCRGRLPTECRPKHLVTVVSAAPSVVAMAPAVLGVRRCLLLSLGEPRGAIAAALAQVRANLEGLGVECQPQTFTGDSFLEQRQALREIVDDFAPGASRELAFDLTPGYKTLSLALEAAAPPGAWLLYCRHQQDGPDRRVVPGTQGYDCWRKEG